MTTWQWNVILALIRFALASAGYDKFPGADSELQGRQDRDILMEALRRDKVNAD